MFHQPFAAVKVPSVRGKELEIAGRFLNLRSEGGFVANLPPHNHKVFQLTALRKAGHQQATQAAVPPCNNAARSISGCPDVASPGQLLAQLRHLLQLLQAWDIPTALRPCNLLSSLRWLTQTGGLRFRNNGACRIAGRGMAAEFHQAPRDIGLCSCCPDKRPAGSHSRISGQGLAFDHWRILGVLRDQQDAPYLPGLRRPHHSHEATKAPLHSHSHLVAFAVGPWNQQANAGRCLQTSKVRDAGHISQGACADGTPRAVVAKVLRHSAQQCRGDGDFIRAS
mmetsp:Transcript_67687/g.161481  ORF Transcript_67687/g.161481 Transcript_67687/m.161481 type:complete len:281 (+) Transcript_67687:328-1170(+)